MRECLLKEDNYIVIQPFMVVNLNLTGNELIVFAAIYGITSNKGLFYGSIEYLSQWCNCTTRTVITCLNELIKKGLIEKAKTPKGNIYRTKSVNTKLPKPQEEEDLDLAKFFNSEINENQCENISPTDVKNFHTDSEKFSSENVKNFHKETEKFSPNNIVNILGNNLVSKSHCVSNETPIGESPQKEKSDFVKLKEHWLNNYQTLFKQGLVKTSEPIVEWARVGRHIREVLRKHGLSACISALDTAMSDSFALSNGYSLTTVLSASCMNKYINGTNKQLYSRTQRRDLSDKIDIGYLVKGDTGQFEQPQYDLSLIAENNMQEAAWRF